MNFAEQILMDIRGGQVSTDPKEKKAYNLKIVCLLALTTGALALTWWPAAILPAAILARKVQLYFANTF